MAPNRLSDRKFGLMFAAVFFVLAGAAWVFSDKVIVELIGVGAAFLVVALIWPTFLLPLNRGWEKLGHRLGLVSNTILLGAFYFLLVTPVGWMMRMLGNDPMHRKLDRNAESYFSPVGRQSNADTFSDMF